MSNDHAHLTWCDLGYHHWNDDHCTTCGLNITTNTKAGRL